MKKSKLFLCLLILAINISTVLANPFLTGNPHSQDKPSKDPTPVLVGPTNPDLAKTQGTLREKIATFFKSWETSTGPQRNKILWSLILTSFIYGIIHAAGPGHRKTVVFSLYLARKSPWYEPLITGLILALLHGGCAIILILIFKGLSGSISANTKVLSIYMEGFTYGLLIILALVMIIKETVEFIKGRKNQSAPEKEIKENRTTKWLPFLISGVYPCPGAVLILILSFTLDILWAGILAVIFMSLGMAVLIIFVAYLAWFGRKGLFTTLKNHKKAVSNLSYGIEIGSYAFLLLFSLYVSSPFFLSLIR